MGLASSLPLPPRAPRLPPPNSERRTYRAWKFSLFPSLHICPNFPPLSPSSLPPHLLPLPPLTPYRPLLSCPLPP